MTHQPKKASPAQTQAEALADVERIARAIYEIVNEDLAEARPWETLGERQREYGRSIVRKLLHRGVIRVGARPDAERPMEGQTKLEEFLDD